MDLLRLSRGPMRPGRSRSFLTARAVEGRGSPLDTAGNEYPFSPQPSLLLILCYCLSLSSLASSRKNFHITHPHAASTSYNIYIVCRPISSESLCSSC